MSLGWPGRQKYSSLFYFQQFHWHVDAYISKISENNKQLLDEVEKYTMIWRADQFSINN